MTLVNCSRQDAVVLVALAVGAAFDPRRLDVLTPDLGRGGSGRPTVLDGKSQHSGGTKLHTSYQFFLLENAKLKSW